MGPRVHTGHGKAKSVYTALTLGWVTGPRKHLFSFRHVILSTSVSVIILSISLPWASPGAFNRLSVTYQNTTGSLILLSFNFPQETP